MLPMVLDSVLGVAMTQGTNELPCLKTLNIDLVIAWPRQLPTRLIGDEVYP